MKKRVVITGLGALTAAGVGAEALWRTFREKKSTLSRIRFGEDASWEPLGAEIKDFIPENYVAQKKSLKVMARDIQLAVATGCLAIDDAGLRSAPIDKERFGVIVGSGVLNHEPDELAYCVKNSLDEEGRLDLLKFGGEGLSSLFPLWLLKYLPNMSACHLSILFDLRGPNNSVTAGASSGLQAVGEAARIIQRGDADLMIAGGAESKLNPVGYSEYEILGLLSKENDPGRIRNAFEGDGLIVGEGAGFLVLEEAEHAKKRGAKIYAEIMGFGSSSNEGRVEAMAQALKEALLSSDRVDHVQACGLGIPTEDRAEQIAMKQIFSGNGASLSVGVSKPLIGFTGFAAGPLDLILSALVLKDQTGPKKIHTAMTNAFGFNGQSVSMILKSAEEMN